MASAEELMAVVGVPAVADAVLALIASDGLVASSDPDLEEGELVRSSLSGFAAGYELLCREGRVNSAFIFVVPSQGYTPFSGPLPGGLSASDTRPAVRRRFGTPERSGDPFTHRVLGQQGAWDRFKVGPLYVHFRYIDPDERIGQVTIMLAEHAL
jgi:hypothetical protein